MWESGSDFLILSRSHYSICNYRTGRGMFKNTFLLYFTTVSHIESMFIVVSGWSCLAGSLRSDIPRQVESGRSMRDRKTGIESEPQTTPELLDF